MLWIGGWGLGVGSQLSIGNGCYPVAEDSHALSAEEEKGREEHEQVFVIAAVGGNEDDHFEGGG